MSLLDEIVIVKRQIAELQQELRELEEAAEDEAKERMKNA